VDVSSSTGVAGQMAFARPIGLPRRTADALMWRSELAAAAPALVASEAQKQKLVSAKDLKKLRKQMTDKMQDALAVKSEMGSVQAQLKALSNAVDTLSQIMVDELESVGSDLARAKVETSDQLATLANGVKSVTPEISTLHSAVDKCKSSADAANASIVKLKRWTESGFRRLNDVLSVQQQALAVLDSQITGFNERIHEDRADVKSCRQESAESKSEFERMRTQVAQVVLHNEELVREYRQHIRVMQTATANCEQATNQKESSTAAQQVEFSKVETMLLEHRAICESRLTALEYTARSPPPPRSTPLTDRRVSELEEDLGRAKRQLSEQDDVIRELQLRLQTHVEKAALTRLADRQEMSDLVSRAVQDFIRNNPQTLAPVSYPPYERPSTSSPPRARTSQDSPERHGGAAAGAFSPLQPPSLDTIQRTPTRTAWPSASLAHSDDVPSETRRSLYPERVSALKFGGGTPERASSRVMEQAQQRVQERSTQLQQLQLARTRGRDETTLRSRASGAQI
jgi:hypothetical protein